MKRTNHSGWSISLARSCCVVFGNFAEAEASAGKIIQEGHHSLFRVTSLNAAQQKEADEMEQYIDLKQRISIRISL